MRHGPPSRKILDLVQAGEEVTLTRHGQPVAVIVRPDTLRARRADQALATATATVRTVLELGRRAPLGLVPTLSEERADALVADVEASRSSGWTPSTPTS